MASLKLADVVKSFGTTMIIHGVDLDVADGEFVVFVGPSGCGKSTLLRIIAGLEQASSGEILLDGKRVNDDPAAARGLAMVFQSYALYPHMSVRQNLAFGLENARMPKADIDDRVDRAAKMLQIDHLLARKPRQLSGGQRQRVAIGRAITRNPKIFLFDEPLSNLDAELRVQMRLELMKLHEDLKATMIYVTHDQVEAMTMADKIVVLRQGRVEQIGHPLDLYNHPANKFVAGFIGSPKMNFVPAKVTGHAADGFDVSIAGLEPMRIDLPSVKVAPETTLTLGVRPEHLVIGDTGWPFEIDVVEQLGGTCFLHGRLPGHDRLTVAGSGQTALRPGTKVRVAPARGQLHAFRTDEGERSLVA